MIKCRDNFAGVKQILLYQILKQNFGVNVKKRGEMGAKVYLVNPGFTLP